MSKLSFVALSLQTTHLDPASVSKASYVKLVDGNITRQDEVLIVPPTSKKKLAEQQTAGPGTAWDEALGQLAMMIGKLPIVSYYRDADKEIFYSASRYLNIEPPPLHWLDCRELARTLLPDLRDVQLSTVLKTLDLYEEYADRNAVEQTAQIVMALAQQQGANTVAQLWDGLYDQPDDLLGLSSTFEGATESGSSSEDDVEAPLAAEVLPVAGATEGTPVEEERSYPTEHGIEPDASETHAPALPDPVTEAERNDEWIAPQEPSGHESQDDISSSNTTDAISPVEEPASEAYEPLTPQPDAASREQELPAFLQEPSHDELEDAESTHADETLQEDAGPADEQKAPEHNETVMPAEKSGFDDTTRDHDDAPAGENEHSELTGAIGDETRSDAYSYPQRFAAQVSFEPTNSRVDHEAPSHTASDQDPQGKDRETSDFLERLARRNEEREKLEADLLDADLVARNEEASRTETLPDRPDPWGTTAVAEDVTSSKSTSSAHVSVQTQEPADSAVSPSKVSADQIFQRPYVEESRRKSSKTSRIFGFVGLFVFGLLSIIGVVLIVMAVMLFFTDNSLLLETKIAGVVLTVAITLLSVLMTSVSYRSFRPKRRL